MCVRFTRAFALKSSLTTWMTLPTPAEPKLSFPGRARASAMSAAGLSSFATALTTMTKGVRALVAAGTTSHAALFAAAAKLKDPRARSRSPRRKVFISSLHERPPADVEILAHGHVHEAARAAQRARDVALALHVLGEDEVSRQAQGAMAVARLELEDARGEENQLAPGSIVKILDVAFGGFAEKNRVAPEGPRRGS